MAEKNSRPNHPTTWGKVGRFQQTMKSWLGAQEPRPHSVAELQVLLDKFALHYNDERPHRSTGGHTPAASYRARPKATAGDRSNDDHFRVRHDVVDRTGRVSLRASGRMHHIGFGMARTGTRVLVHDLGERVDVRPCAVRPIGTRFVSMPGCLAHRSGTKTLLAAARWARRSIFT